MVNTQAQEKFSIKRFDYKLQRYNLDAEAVGIFPNPTEAIRGKETAASD